MNELRLPPDTPIQYEEGLWELCTDRAYEMMNESRLNCSNPSELPDRMEVLLNLVYAKAFTVGYEADKNPKVDFNLIENQDRIYKYK